MMLFEKKINKQNLYDMKVDKYQRVVTFEGPEYFSTNCNSLFISPRQDNYSSTLGPNQGTS